MAARGGRIWHDRQPGFGEIRSRLRTVKGLKAKILAGKSLDDAPRSRRPCSVRTLENVTAVSQAIKDKPRKSIRQLSEIVHPERDPPGPEHEVEVGPEYDTFHRGSASAAFGGKPTPSQLHEEPQKRQPRRCVLPCRPMTIRSAKTSGAYCRKMFKDHPIQIWNLSRHTWWRPERRRMLPTSSRLTSLSVPVRKPSSRLTVATSSERGVEICG